jgi:hypothetical protein
MAQILHLNDIVKIEPGHRSQGRLERQKVGHQSQGHPEQGCQALHQADLRSGRGEVGLRQVAGEVGALEADNRFSLLGPFWCK